MAKATKFRIEPTIPTGWYKVVNKETGACMDVTKGYDAALLAYRRLNNPKAATKIPPMPKESRAKSQRSMGPKSRAR